MGGFRDGPDLPDGAFSDGTLVGIFEDVGLVVSTAVGRGLGLGVGIFVGAALGAALG